MTAMHGPTNVLLLGVAPCATATAAPVRDWLDSFSVTLSPGNPADGVNWTQSPANSSHAILRIHQPLPDVTSGPWKRPESEKPGN